MSTIKVTSHNYPALVQTFDLKQIDGRPAGKDSVSEEVLRPEDGERSYYCTTTRQLVISDIENDDPRAKK